MGRLSTRSAKALCLAQKFNMGKTPDELFDRLKSAYGLEIAAASRAMANTLTALVECHKSGTYTRSESCFQGSYVNPQRLLSEIQIDSYSVYFDPTGGTRRFRDGVECDYQFKVSGQGLAIWSIPFPWPRIGYRDEGNVEPLSARLHVFIGPNGLLRGEYGQDYRRHFDRYLPTWESIRGVDGKILSSSATEHFTGDQLYQRDFANTFRLEAGKEAARIEHVRVKEWLLSILD